MKTRYDIAEELVKAFPYSDTIKDNDTTIVDIVLSLAEEWISVEDELPIESPYLGQDESGKIELFKVTDKSFIKAMGIVLWRPINRKRR